MKFIRRLPVYAAGAGLAAAVVAVADARNWSGAQTLLVALGVGAFYVVTIFVPSLIREQVEATALRQAKAANGHPGKNGGLAIVLRADQQARLQGDHLVAFEPDPRSSRTPVTYGEPVITGAGRHAVTG